MKVINVQGRKKTGKTTTVTAIIAELVRRGYSVGSIKGIHVEDFSMDSADADTGKHKAAGADPVTARCHGETNIMFTERMDLQEILTHYHNDWVVIESHVDLHCPNIITGRTAEYDGEGKDVSLAEQINGQTICCSGVIANELSGFRGLPVVNAMTDAERLVDIIEERCTAEFSSNEPEEFSLIETNDMTCICADGSVIPKQDRMLTENSLDIAINGRLTGCIPCSPQYMTELVLGWLRYEGHISSIDEVGSVTFSGDGTRADVEILGYYPDGKGRRVPLVRVRPIKWEKEWIYALAKDFEKGLPLREQTMAAHNCRLAVGAGEEVDIIFRCEDIGRHSAIDKAVGWAMRNGVDPGSCIMFTSGRISRAMTMKAISAGIPVLAGKGTISKRAVQLADAYGLTLIGYAGPESFCIFSGQTER